MTDYFIKVLNNLLNYGIRIDENLTSEERIRRIRTFKDNFLLQDQMVLLNALQDYLVSSEISSDDKNKVILLMIDFIRSFLILESNVDKFPPVIIHIYNSHMALIRLVILFEDATKYGAITNSIGFKTVISEYIDYLDNPEYEFYIHNCYSKIENFNRMIQNYLLKQNIEGVKHKDALEDIQLTLTIMKKINILNANRIRKKD